MKYNLAKIMKRAWQIKKEEDRKALNRAYNHNRRTVEDTEKALFSECLKIAWEEAKNVENLSEKETELKIEEGGEVKWNIWRKYGKNRAYYTVSTRSNYADRKKDNFVEIM